MRENAKRTACIVCRPDHDLWKLKTFEEVKAFLVQSFPQIDFPTFIDDEEIARFANSYAGAFPEPQYVKGIQELFKGPNKGRNKKNVVIKLIWFKSIESCCVWDCTGP